MNTNRLSTLSDFSTRYAAKYWEPTSLPCHTSIATPNATATPM